MDEKVLRRISYGLYIISSKKGDKLNAMVSNTVMQVASEPPSITASINKQCLTHEFVLESKVFTASILSRYTPLKFIGHFGFKSGRDIDKFKDIKYKPGITGAPIILENSIGYIEAEMINNVDVGAHTVFIGKIVDSGFINDEEPMTYAYYHSAKRGVTPENAPSYISQEKQKGGETKMKKYKCIVCGYIYDPEKGDPDSEVKPGTAFEDLPDAWVCPICGAGKDKFEEAT